MEPKKSNGNFRDVMMTVKTDYSDVDQENKEDDSDDVAAFSATLSSTAQTVTFICTRREQVRRERHEGAATLQQGALLVCRQVGDIVTLESSSPLLYAMTKILNNITLSVRSTSCDDGVCV